LLDEKLGCFRRGGLRGFDRIVGGSRRIGLVDW